MNRKSSKSILALLFLVCFIFLSAPLQAEEKITDLVILHTNDSHGNLQKIYETGASMAKTISEVRTTCLKKDGVHLLLLDAGDITSYKEPNFSNVEKDLLMMDSLGYDAMALGNHEIDFGLFEFANLAKKVKFPVLSASITDKVTGGFVFKPYVIKELGKLRVGIISFTTKVIMEKMKPEDAAKIKFHETEEAYSKIISEVREKSDIIVALTHLGVEEDRELAKAHPEIKLIIGSHSHTLLDKPEFVGKTCIVQTGRFSENLGKLDIKIIGKELKSIDGSVISLNKK